MLNAPINRLEHHRCLYFEELWKRHCGLPCTTYSFAIDGQMASDAYLIAKTLNQLHRMPRYIVYGIVPRDLMNNGLASPSSTGTFKYLRNVIDLSDWDLSAHSSAEEKRDYVLSKCSALASGKTHFLTVGRQLQSALFDKLFGPTDAEEVHTMQPLRDLATFHNPDDHGSNEGWVFPTRTCLTLPAKDLDIYRLNYLPLRPDHYKLELLFFERLLSLTERTGTRLIVVNMPLPSDHLAILPTSVYENYLESVRSLANRHHASFVDMNNATMFTNDSFRDSAHLNALGAQRLLDHLTPNVALDLQLARESKLETATY
jgi:hypothetical protein